MTQILKAVTFAAALYLSSAAQAATYSPADIRSGASAGASFAATGGNLVIKNRHGVQGVGVSGGATGGEIDIGEKISASFGSAGGVRIGAFQLAYLFDGPEFGDVQEAARVTATFADLSTVSYQLTALYKNKYAWTGLGSVLAPSTAKADKGGFWTVNDPFGDKAVTGLSFTAVQGVCGIGRCNNQSDFAVASITTAPVPEPATYALMLAGLAGVGAVARRRNARR